MNMKRYITALLLSILAVGATAQNFPTYKIGLMNGEGELSLSTPTTNISVELLIEKEVVTPGVYARYAQKYLGYRAPLVAQTTYNIVDAAIALADTDNHKKPLSPNKETNTEYGNLPVDQTSSTVLAAEDAARNAASAIFTIRRQRHDIISGEAGEGYFGAGLKDAMQRLDELEQEYLNLFMGSRTTSQFTKQYTFTPLEDATRHVISRFDPRSGLLPDTDLTGTPIYVQFTVQDYPDTSSIEATEKSKTKILYRVAASTQCVLYNDSEVLASAIMPIFELGKDLTIDPTPRK